MDFEISPDGELLSYHGLDSHVIVPEGVKFIARDCKFDNAQSILSISLPQSFLGFKERQQADNFFFINTETHELESVWICFSNYGDNTPFALPQSTSVAVYYYLDRLPLPKLAKYHVHESNPIYHSIGGLLYTKCKRYLLSVPADFSDVIDMPLEFQRISCKIDEECISGDVTVNYYDDRITGAELGEILKLIKDRALIYAPNAKHFYSFNKDSYWASNQHKCICFFPKVEFVLDEEGDEAASIAMGYCFKPELYTAKQAQKCADLLLAQESFIYFRAERRALKPVLDFYHKAWVSPLEKRKLGKDFCTSRYLIEAVLHGTVEDMQRALDTKFHFLGKISASKNLECDLFSGAQAIALACRYGGYEKLKCLLDDANFCKQHKNGFFTDCNLTYFTKGDYHLWLSGVFKLQTLTHKTHLHIDDSNEIRGMQPCSQAERIKCLELLIDRGVFEESQDLYLCEIYVYALLTEEDELATYLRSFDLSFDFYAPAIGQRNDGYQDLNYLIINACDHYPRGIIALLKAYSEHDCDIKLQLNTLEFVSSVDGDLFNQMLDYVTVSPRSFEKLISLFITDGRIKQLTPLLEKVGVKTRRTFSKYMDMATDTANAEIIAYMLDYQERHFAKPTKRGTGKSRGPSLKL